MIIRRNPHAKIERQGKVAYYYSQNKADLVRLTAINKRRNVLFDRISARDATAKERLEYQSLNAEKLEIEARLKNFKINNGW